MKALVKFWGPVMDSEGKYHLYSPGDEINPDHIGERTEELIRRGYIQETEKKVAKKKPAAKKKVGTPKGAKK